MGWLKMEVKKAQKVVTGVDIMKYTGNLNTPPLQAYTADGYETVMYWLPKGSCTNIELKLDEEYESLTNNPGIYILVGGTLDEVIMYIGKADMKKDGKALYKRIVDHTINGDNHTEWDYALAFSNKWSGNSWDAALTKSIEAVLIEELKSNCYKLYVIEDEDIITTTVYEQNHKSETADKIDINRVIPRVNAIKTLLINNNLRIAASIEESTVSIGEAVARNFIITNKALEDARQLRENQREIQDKQNALIEAAYSIIKEEKNGYNTYLEKIFSTEIRSYSNGQIETMNGIYEMPAPNDVVIKMVEMLPKETFYSSAKFLDLASTSGEFLLGILDRIMTDETLPIAIEIPDKADRLKHVVKNCLYGITTSNVALQLNRINFANKIEEYKKRIGDSASHLFVYPNIKYISDGDDNSTAYIRLIKNKDTRELYNNIREIFNLESGDTMKFDVVIGNPPYQENNGGGNGSGGATLYNYFIDKGLALADIVCMITKDSWMQQEQLKSTRDNMIKAGIVSIKDYPKIHEIFDKVDVACSIFLIKKGYTGETHFYRIEDGKITSEYSKRLTNMMYVPSNEIEFSIYDKVVQQYQQSFNIHVRSNTPFGIRTNGNVGGVEINQSDIQNGDYNIPILYIIDGRPDYRYTTIADIPQKGIDIVNHYKIICGQQFNKNETVISSITGLNPGSICSSSFGVLYSSEGKLEAYNAYKYIKTRFFRYLVYLMIETVSTISASRVKLVPEQDFSEQSDIDWSKSIAEINEQLYCKYGINETEKNYIESKIKHID